MLTFKKISILITLLLFIGIGCGTPGSLTSDEITDVAGVVVESDSYDRIANASVQINETEKSAITDENGIFTLRQVETGNHTITIETENHGTVEQDVTITDGGTRLELKVQ
jgi:hypothetical protein